MSGNVRKTTGKVLFTMAGVDYVCSGSVVEDTSSTRSLVLTAGHCVYDEKGSSPATSWATNWMFVPDYQDGGSIVTVDGVHRFTCDATPYGCWTAKSLVTTSAWANGGGSLAGFNNDYAFAVIDESSGANHLDATVGANAISFAARGTEVVYSFGYPQASPYDGQKLIYCAGTEIADSYGGTSDWGLNCNQTGGSSGGPWFKSFTAATETGTLTSVNSFKYTAGKFKNYMFGPSFGPYTFKTYTVATTADVNTTVAP